MMIADYGIFIEILGFVILMINGMKEKTEYRQGSPPDVITWRFFNSNQIAWFVDRIRRHNEFEPARPPTLTMEQYQEQIKNMMSMRSANFDMIKRLQRMTQVTPPQPKNRFHGVKISKKKWDIIFSLGIIGIIDGLFLQHSEIINWFSYYFPHI